MANVKMDRISIWQILAAFFGMCFVGAFTLNAKSPDNIKLGKQLFEREWSRSNPKLGSDGLGPLFNATSCSSCHNEGGSGGGGEARFNAMSIGIEQMKITGRGITNDIVARMLRSFHPGFIQPGGTIQNTLSLSHHGGSMQLGKIRDAILAQLAVALSEEGGPENANEVRLANATPITFQHTHSKYEMTVQARLFQRNTTALFGAGLIDQVPDREIKAQHRAQGRHPEISGRPSTLTDGRIGKFGWRANIATLLDFNDQACANEVGLATRRRPQPADPTTPSYRNPSHDISDNQIHAMNAFVEALPAPIREIPKETFERRETERGEQLFNHVGCAVCHVQDMGPAKGIYSDLLLHDMGYELLDLNHAEPYIRRILPVTEITTIQKIRDQERRSEMASYYGGTTEITIHSASSKITRTTSTLRRSPTNSYRFTSPNQPAPKFRTRLSQKPIHDPFYFNNETAIKRDDLVENRYVEVFIEPTNFNQEWRTPPLWGLRDSAPYMHDGRAETVLEAISMHDGESAGTRDRFLKLSLADRYAILAFLNTLVAPTGMDSGTL